MAKKFVKVNGLHNVFEASANIASSTIKSGASASVDANSILFITADADDEEIFGASYPSMKEGAHYIWAQGVLHDTNSGVVNVGVTGEEPHIKVTGSMTPSGPSFVISHTAPSTGVTTAGKVQTQPKAAGTAGTAGTTGVLKIPTITVDDKGHVSSLSDTTINIPIPNHYKHPQFNVFIGGATTKYDPDVQTDKFIDVDAAINSKIAPFENAMHFIGKATVDLTDGATTGATALGITGYTTSDKGDIVLDKSGIHEYIWTGSAWEQIGYLVSASAAGVTGATYKIGEIVVEGATTVFYGKDTVTEVSYTDSSKTGTTYEIGTITINGTPKTLVGRDNDTKYGATNGIVAQTGGTIFQADLHSHTKFGATAIASTSASRYYRVGLDAAGKLAVNVPWEANTNTAHKHTAGTGLTCDNTTGSTSGTVKYSLNAATSSAIGGIAIGYSENGKNYPVELDANNKAYVNVPWQNTTYGASGGVELADSKFRAALHSWEIMGATGVASSSASRYYRVGLDAAGKLAVNVPWTDTAHAHAAGDGIVLTGDTNGGTGTSTTTIGVTAATTTKYGGIKTNYTASGKNYPVKLDTNGNAYVSVPWADPVTPIQPNNGTLTLKIAGTVGATHSANTSANAEFNVPEASASAYGVIKVSSKNTSAVTVNSESTTAGRYYPIELNSDGKAIVNVPWTDTNTTYTLSGAVVGTTGSAAANTSVTTAVASAVSFKDTLTPSSGNATTSTCILMNGDGSINLKAVSGKNNAIEIDYTGVATAEDWATIG